MGKPYRKHMVVLILIAGLIAAQALLPQKQVDTTVADATYPVANLSVAEVAAVAIRNAQSVMGLTLGANGIEVDPGAKLTYAQTELQSTVYSLCHIDGTLKLETPESLAPLDFANPQASFALLPAAGEPLRFRLSAQRAPNGECYLYSEADQAAYLVPAEIGERLLRTEKDYVEQTLFTAFTTGDTTTGAVRVTYPQEAERDFAVTWQAGMAFTLTEPVRARLSALQAVTKLWIPVTAIYPDQVVALDANLADYGLDAPELEIAYTLNGVTQKVRFAGNDDGYMAAREGERTVFHISRDSLLFLASGYEGLLDGKVFQFNAADLKQVRLEAAGAQTVWEGDALAQQTALLSAPIAGVAQGATAEPAVARLTYTRQNGGVTEVVIGPAHDGLCAVAVDGDVSFMAPETYVQALLALAAPADGATEGANP